jgi:hypothetical protein
MLVAAWHPVTCDFGLIHAPLETVVNGLLSWHGSIGTRYRRIEITEGLEAAFKALLPLSHAKQRRLYVQTMSDWVACYQNRIEGSDPFPAMSFLAKELGVLAMRVCSTPPKATWPSNIWEVYAPPSLGGILPLGYRRSIAAANDGGHWVFEESGEAFEFERTELYRARRKKDRFTRELLEEYLNHFGIRPFDDSFFVVDKAHEAVLLERTQPVFTLPEYTLEEVVAGAPWQRNPNVP